ncbi:hypothetical protein A2U01_0007245 [Trifolium medium]|uniref:Uncharacterized protein n=1 Tax=Trifolium medium TaxID=97028 RepID=A0A392MI33_9FABA|nr:hypothetical protein [Trifolium medium]
MIFCFVEFTEPKCALTAMEALQVLDINCITDPQFVPGHELRILAEQVLDTLRGFCLVVRDLGSMLDRGPGFDPQLHCKPKLKVYFVNPPFRP